jgi:hypothetical protein
MISPDSDARLVQNATLALRVIAHRGGQGIALGQVVVVGANGGEPLLDAPGLIEVHPGGSGDR